MPDETPAYVRNLAKEMRGEPTPAENLLWNQLRHRQLDGFKFYRQYAIGRYILDFYCPERNLVVELDGEIHESERQREYDNIRAAVLNGKGLQIVRFKNDQVLSDMENVLFQIRYCLSY